MKPGSEQVWLLMGVGGLSIVIGLISATSYQNAMEMIEHTQQSKQTYEVMKTLGNIFATMTVAESGRRGYVFLNDTNEYFRYQNAIHSLELDLQALKQTLAHKPEQQQRAFRLEVLLHERLRLLDQSIDLYQIDKSALATQQQITYDSIALRDRIQLVIDEIQTTEDKRLQQGLKQSQISIRHRLILEFSVMAFSFTLLWTLALVLNWQLGKRRQAEIQQSKLRQENELNDLKLRFFSMVSHEFRTPLSVILGSVQLLTDGNPTSGDRLSKNLQRIQGAAKVMTRLLTDTLMLTRAAAGKLDCQPRCLDVEAFCLNLVEDLAATGATIRLSSCGSTAYGTLDETLLYSILTNLLSNAIKYSTTGIADLVIDCRPEATRLVIQDEGMGILPDELPHIFEPFYRGSQVGTLSGSGLGLAVVKTAVELHHGTIAVDSHASIGTRFTVTIPHLPTV